MNIPEFNEIIELNDQTEARREHLERLRDLIGNVYPNKYERTKISGAEDTISNLLAFAPIIEIVSELKDNTPEGEKPNQELKESLNNKLKTFGNVRISGRLAVPPRVMGKAAFVHLSDGANRLQIYVRKQDAKAISGDTGKPIDEEGKAWEVFGLLDHGDFVGVEGYLFLTNTGELSVHVETIQFLAKAMLPMPDKMHGINDPELQRRYRYADLIASSLQIEHEGLTTREVFERRAKLISGMRNYLDAHGYIEVETPMLTPKATGAAAKPFKTHHNALDIELYARIAPELYLKRLTVGGFEKVYELNRNFRNEGLSHKHSPEFTMLEFYCAYMDVNGMMDFSEAIIKESVQKANNRSLVVNYDSKDIDFSEFKRWTMKKAIDEYFPRYLIPNFDVSWLDDETKIFPLAKFSRLYYVNANGCFMSKDNQIIQVDESIRKEYEKQGWIGIPDQDSALTSEPEHAQKWLEKFTNSSVNDKNFNKDAELVSIFESIAESKIIQPTFIIDYPKSISPLSKASPENPNIAERFELFINGMECANGFSELNDPQEQYERFVDQMKERESGDKEAMVLDEDYIRALGYGMPPAAGIGIGIDRLVMLLTNRHSIRDVILFPHMRPEKKMHEDPDTDVLNNGEVAE